MSLPSSEPVQEVARIRVPPQACQHPFVYNQEGFCVRAGEQKGTKSVPKTFKRMNSGDLYQHLTSATSPTGNEDDDIAFYAAQLIHYGIPADWNKNRAVNTLKSLYQKRKDGPVIHVPDTITQVEKKLKKQYEDLMSRLDAANSLSETTAELEAERANLAKSQLRADKAQKKLEEAQTDVAVVKKKIKGLEALVEQRKTRLAKVEKAQQKPKPKSKTEAESDVERASLAKPEEKEGTRLAGKRNIDAIATQSSCPEKPQKKQKLVEPSVGTGGAGGNCVEVAPETPQPASCEASTNATNQAGRQMSSRKPAKQASQIVSPTSMEKRLDSEVRFYCYP